MLTAKARIDSVVYSNESGFCILKVTGQDRITQDISFVAKGVCPDFGILGSPKKAVGLGCVLTGAWKNVPKYGKQFEADRIVLEQTGLKFFFENVVQGIGKLAQVLVEQFGEEKLIEILDNAPEELLNIKGIKTKRLERIVKSWQKYRQLKNIGVFFASHGVESTPGFLMRVFNHFNDPDTDIPALLTKNPYRLTEMRRVGFKTADKIALKIGFDPYSPFRIKALVDYVLLEQASDAGHTYLFEKNLEQIASEEVSETLDLDKFRPVFEEVVKDQQSYYGDNDGRIALSGYRFQEDWIESFFKDRSERKNSRFALSPEEALTFIRKKEQQTTITFSPEQREAVFRVATEGPAAFILCGYAGTGKSTISKVLCDFYAEFCVEPQEIVTCAFTGMASKRIREVTGYTSNTIHSLLGWSKTGFKHNAHHPLPHRVILIDECSMINLGLIYCLLRAVREDAAVILVGDDAQLPPIGEGNVFADLLSKQFVPKVKLTRIYRQSEDSVLVVFANEIREGRLPAEFEGTYRDFAFIPMDIPNYWAVKKSSTEQEMKTIRENFHQNLQDRLLGEIGSLSDQNNLAPVERIWKIQVITPMKNTLLGTNILNLKLQAFLNPHPKEQTDIRGFTLKTQDKVIHLVNQDMFTVSYEDFRTGVVQGRSLAEIAESAGKSRIYNGNIGIVWTIDATDGFFAVLYPDGSGANRFVIYSFDDYKNIVDLGYALTIHKVQGNQFDYVFIPMINSFYIMLNSKLVYTAITRGKKKAVLIGQPYAFRKSCESLDEIRRQTFLGLATSSTA